MAGLLIAGTVVFCAGVLTVVWGVPIRDFSFGSTLILVGSIVACTGLLMIGLSFVVREVKKLGRLLEAGASRDKVRGEVSALAPRVDVPLSTTAPELPKVARPTPPARPAPSGGFLFPRDEPRDRKAADIKASDFKASDLDTRTEPADDEPALPPWRDDALTRRSSTLFPKAEETAETAEASTERPRRNFLFASRRRSGLAGSAADAPQDGEEATSAAEELPALDAAREVTDRVEPSHRFDTAWPSTERARADNGVSRSNGAGRFSTPRRNEEPATPAVTVVKSGVVDAMEYKLYSDGSIEAQMPEGMVRFESIDALRAHLGQND
jgi:hypothetical protein